MMDQNGLGLSVGYVGEGQLDPSISDSVLEGKYQLVLISPEKIVNNTAYRNMLLSKPYQNNIIGLAVDEAHCVQTW